MNLKTMNLICSASKAARSTPVKAVTPPIYRQIRGFQNSRTRFEEKEEKPSFRGQLYESTAQRLQRERANEARYIDAQAARNPKLGQRTFLISTCWYL